MSEHQWLQDLKVGDTVVTPMTFYGFRTVKVTRITPTQIHCDCAKYRKSDGHSIGLSPRSSHYIGELAGDVKDQIEHDELVKKADALIYRCKTDSLSNDQIKRIIDALSKPNEDLQP